MGYISIQINKAKGSADTGASDHIERKTTPKNANPTRTHLNRELVQFPDGVADRTGAISHRIRTTGIRRKITPDQVRAIRIVLSGTHEDMARVQDEGRLAEWCDDNLQWLHRTFGRENTVSAVLHMDEHTPHIHATVVPIVTGKRRKARKKQAGKQGRSRRTADAPTARKSTPCACVPMTCLPVKNLLPTTTAMPQRWRSTACSVASVVRRHGTPPPPNTTVT